MSPLEAERPIAWGRGTTVSVSRLPGPDQTTVRPIGIGELTDRLEIGRPIQLRLDAGDGGRLFAATSIVRIEITGPNVVRIETRNHRYEMRRVEAALAGASPAGRGESRSAGDQASSGHDATCVVSVDDWPEPEPGRFETGARVWLTQERDGERRELGLAILLGEIVPAQSASFAVDGRVIATSAVREVIERGKRAIRIATGNSTYDLELAAPAEGSSGE